jgi:leader peptidase (prepilin peptidase) / N-methyltransferase
LQRFFGSIITLYFWVFGAVLAGALVVASIVDIRERRLPDVLTLSLVAMGLGVTALTSPSQLVVHVFASAAAYVFVWLTATVFRVLRGYDGLGMGDAKLLAAVGAWLGPLYLAPVVMLGAALALVAVLVLGATGRPMTLRTALPFGPFLSVGFFGLWCLDAVAPLYS